MNTTEIKTPYGSIFRAGDREWFPGSVEQFRTAKAWEESRVMTLERARAIGAPITGTLGVCPASSIS